MVCSKCGTDNEAGLRFCIECGSPLPPGCPACGTVGRTSAKFCGACGFDLTAPIDRDGPASPDTDQAPVAERRLVSVLFADLVGFTALTEGHDAEDARALLSRYFDLTRGVIGRYGGTVEKFIGDAVMAVWGAPVAHEDDAERAVRAGLDLLNVVKDLGPGIAARAGVMTGEAAVTIGATDQGMVAGDLVNTASRLQSVAAPGALLVGEATQRAASRAIAFAPAGSEMLKGRSAPVPAWQALRVIAQVGGRNRADILEAPFVGRDDELRLLKDLYLATTRERRTRLVSVIGPAGIGKSRLAWEFSKYVDGLVDAAWFLDGRSPAYGDGISFWALGEMVRQMAGLLETDDEATTRARIAETVAAHVPDEGERRWVEPALLALLGVDAGSVASDELFAAWRTFIERLAASAPVVMVFEDLHHADGGLIDFIDHLVEWSRTLPIYLVTLARPELLERRPAGAGKRSFTSTFLEPLTAAAMGELLAGLVPGLPHEAQQAIVSRADGIPLYVVETVRMLQGKLTLEGGTYRPTEDLSSLAMPETLTACIASRLDELPADERAIVADAAVLGRSFTSAGLAFVSGQEVAALEPRLGHLVKREILTLQTDLRSPERGQYAFVQALIREVAYNTLAKRDRTRRHLAAAQFFQGLGTEEMAGGLAAHYLAARGNASEGPEADAIAAQAKSALRAAAERAASLGSPDQALLFFDQALLVTTDPSETAELLERAGEAANAAGRHEDAADRLQRAVQARRELGDRVATAQAVASLGRALLDASNRANRAEARALLEPAAVEFADLMPEPAVVALRGQIARACMSDEARKAIEVVDAVLEAAELADLTELLAEALVTKGIALVNLGRVEEGLGTLRTGQDVAQQHGLSRTVIRAIDNRLGLEADRDPRAAFELGVPGLALARRLGRRADAVWTFGLAAWCALRTGDWAWAIAELDTLPNEQLGLLERVDPAAVAILFGALRGLPVDGLLRDLAAMAGEHPEGMIGFDLELARMFSHFATGRLPEVRAARRLAAAAIEEPGALSNYGARAALWSLDLAGAADELATSDGGKPGKVVIADRLTIRAGIAALEGRPDDALPMYRDALRSWRDLGLAWDEALCGIDMASLLDPTDPEVRAAAELSRQILVRLEAAPFSARLDAALGRGSDTAAAIGTPR